MIPAFIFWNFHMQGLLHCSQYFTFVEILDKFWGMIWRERIIDISKEEREIWHGNNFKATAYKHDI